MPDRVFDDYQTVALDALREKRRLEAMVDDLRTKQAELEEQLAHSETANDLMFDECWEIIALVDKDLLTDEMPLHEKVRRTLENRKK